jgi:hypothetical protein
MIRDRPESLHPPCIDQVQFIRAGRNCCWYDDGWHGPGWYWCEYAFRTGLGWGGGYGWHGWRGGHPGAEVVAVTAMVMVEAVMVEAVMAAAVMAAAVMAAAVMAAAIAATPYRAAVHYLV